jgi:hypothetical protein
VLCLTNEQLISLSCKPYCLKQLPAAACHCGFEDTSLRFQFVFMNYISTSTVAGAQQAAQWAGIWINQPGVQKQLSARTRNQAVHK